MSKDEAIKQLQGMVVGAEWLSDSMVQALSVAIEALSADVVEVKHGHWDFQGLVDDIYAHGASCSVCGEYSEDNGYYCSCCGAKMDDALQRKTNPGVFKGGEEHE